MHKARRPDDDGNPHQYGGNTGYQKIRDDGKGRLISMKPHFVCLSDGVNYIAVRGSIALQHFKKAMTHAAYAENDTERGNDCLDRTIDVALFCINSIFAYHYSTSLIRPDNTQSTI